jgi:hypothetical protein
MRAYHFTEGAPIGISQFLKIWREEMPWVKVGRKRSRFAECQDCSVLKRIIQNGNDRARIRAQELLAKHRELQAQQRQKYYKHREKAIQHQMKYLSIIMDAMDQKKTELPQVLRKSKKHDQTQGAGLKQKVVALIMLYAVSSLYLPDLTARVAALFLKLMGVKVHGVGTWLYATSSPVAVGSNFNLECLSRTLAHVKERRNGILPDTLYLQLGECLCGSFLYGVFRLTSQFDSTFHCALRRQCVGQQVRNDNDVLPVVGGDRCFQENQGLLPDCGAYA